MKVKKKPPKEWGIKLWEFTEDPERSGKGRDYVMYHEEQINLCLNITSTNDKRN